MPDPARVVVVGGGITGLAAARVLRQAGLGVTLVEAGDRLGGKIKTLELDGVPVEAGPDTFLARVPFAVDLCRELGLGDDLVEPATGRAWLWIGDRLRPLPERHVLGVPTALLPLVRSGVLSPVGVVRAALDIVLPRSSRDDDPSVADVVGTRMGQEVLDRLVEPLVGGIHAGRADRLSLASVAPQVAAAAEASRSLLLGLRRQQAAAAAAPGGPAPPPGRAPPSPAPGRAPPRAPPPAGPRRPAAAGPRRCCGRGSASACRTTGTGRCGRRTRP
jgi:oxygen-dependent protoporphyrinogen oxidase